jgi:ribosomal protein S18 acetylase RimI-like enzyme
MSLPNPPTSSVDIRPAQPSDQPFMREMLAQSIHLEPDDPVLRNKLAELPEISHYLNGWGQPHDYGLIAEDAATHNALGAIWLRLFSEHERGYGYVDDHTPEVCTMCVAAPHRGRGIGTALMSTLLAYVDAHYASVSLSCDPRNPALRLYERFGFIVTGESGTSYTLLRTRSMAVLTSQVSEPARSENK